MTFLDFCPTSLSTPTSDTIVVKVWQNMYRLTSRAQLLEGERYSTIRRCGLLPMSYMALRTSFLKNRKGLKRKKDDATRMCLCIAVVVVTVINVCYA